MRIVVRVGDKEDLPEIVGLYRRFRENLRGERGGDFYLLKEALSEPLESQIAALLGDKEHLVLLGILEDVPVGLAVGRLSELVDASLAASIEVLYVDPEAREVGIGESMLEAVTDWASRGGADSLEIMVLPGMRQAKNFLEGAGYAARLLVMHRRLS